MLRRSLTLDNPRRETTRSPSERTATTFSIEEYLATSFRPDVEYVDGTLRPRPWVSPAHGRVQALLSRWFGNHEDEWGVQVLVETRTQVELDRMRLPDVAILKAGPLPDRVLVDPPVIAIEVLSDTDTDEDLKLRALDLEAMRVQNIWLLDPEAKSAQIWSAGTWQPTKHQLLQLRDSPIHLDLTWLWQKLAV